MRFVCAKIQDMFLAGASVADDAAFSEEIMSHFTDIEREKLLRIDCASEGGKQAPGSGAMREDIW